MSDSQQRLDDDYESPLPWYIAGVNTLGNEPPHVIADLESDLRRSQRRIDELERRVHELLASGTRLVELRREAERIARISATTTMLYTEKFDNIAQLVGLKDGHSSHWLEPDEVVSAVEAIVAALNPPAEVTPAEERTV